MWPGRKLCAGRRSPDIAGVGAGGDRSTGRDHDEPPRRRERPADSVVGGTAHGAGLANAAGGQTSRSPGEYSPPPVKTSCRKAKPNSTAGPLPFSSGCSPLGWCCQNWAAAISPAAISRYAGEQSDQDHHAQDPFDQTSAPERLGANRRGARVDGPGEQLGCTMDGVQEIQDDAKMLGAAEELVLSRASRLDVMGRPPCAVRKFATRAGPLPGRH